MSSTFRHNTHPELAQQLKQFAQANRYFDRKLYKENWEKWCEDNQELISQEERSLRENNYKGDVMSKLYKSARYYYSKKTNEQEKLPYTPRKKYVGVGNIIIKAMDEHIHANMFLKEYTPAKGLDMFCKENTDMLRSEIKLICEKNSGLTNRDIVHKIKKTYKNRYFLKAKNKKIDDENTKD